MIQQWIGEKTCTYLCACALRGCKSIKLDSSLHGVCIKDYLSSGCPVVVLCFIGIACSLL